MGGNCKSCSYPAIDLQSGNKLVSEEKESCLFYWSAGGESWSMEVFFCDEFPLASLNPAEFANVSYRNYNSQTLPSGIEKG